MEQQGAELQTQTLSCSICLDFLKEPVTTSCGHSYCKTCISKYWDAEKEKHIYTCPECKKMFTKRPDLGKNIMLAELLKRHKLMDPSKKIQEKICSHHDEVMKMFCRTDQQCICVICSKEEHKDHEIVSAAAERIERQRELQESQDDIHKNIQDREKDVELLKEQEKTINLSADQTVEHNEQMFTEMIRLLRSKQQTEVSSVRALQEKLEQEISELKKRDAELQQISTTEDHIQFVLSYSSLSELSVSTHSSIILRDPGNCFEEVTAAVSQLREHLHKVLKEDWTNVCLTVEREDDLPSELQSRAAFLKYSQEITLDPNTAHNKLRLSDGDRKVTFFENKHHPDHPERFTGFYQVLSRDSLSGRCYWEVEWSGEAVHLTVAYKSISRAGRSDECLFGFNDKSWKLKCFPNGYTFRHNSIKSPIPGPQSSRIGVYVDHAAGILAFYSISETMTLLHRVNTTFTEPLHAGFNVHYGAAELCKL